jgi:hypothetical protein
MVDYAPAYLHALQYRSSSRFSRVITCSRMYLRALRRVRADALRHTRPGLTHVVVVDTLLISAAAFVPISTRTTADRTLSRLPRIRFVLASVS